MSIVSDSVEMSAASSKMPAVDSRISYPVLKHYILGFLIILSVFTVPMLLASVNQSLTGGGLVAGFILGFASLLLLQAGQNRFSAYFIIWGSWLLVAVLVLLTGGARSVDAYYFAPVLCSAALILGSRFAFVMAGLSVATLLLAHFFAAQLPAPKGLFPPLMVITIHGAIFVFLLLPLRIAITSLRQTVKESKDELTQRLATEVKLRESEAQLRAVIEAISGAVFLLHPATGLILDANKNAEPLFGQSPDALKQLNLLDLIVDKQDQVLLALQTAINEGPQSLEIQIYGKAGQRLWVELVCSRTVIYGQVRVLGIVRDISERLELERRLVQSQKMEAIGTLAGGVAHDFNNILCSIIGFTELAKMDAGEDVELIEKLEQVLQSSGRAKDLVTQILTFSRRNKQEMKPVDPATLVMDSFKLLRPLLPASIDIQVELAPGLPSILGDVSQLHQILMNLGNNAAHAMRHIAQPRLLVRSLLQDAPVDLQASNPQLLPEQTLLLEVVDNGQGMDKETLSRIFEPFFTTKPLGEGTGLGLSVVHGIVKSHQGAILVISEPGQGASMRLFFPVLRTSVTQQPLAEEQEFQGRNERILFVDDEVVLCNYMSHLLSRFGLEVTVENDSRKALERIQNLETYDLVISDLTMPHVTGLQLAEALRAHDQVTPFILASGLIHRELQPELKRLAIHCVLPKPYSSFSVAAALNRALGRQAA